MLAVVFYRLALYIHAFLTSIKDFAKAIVKLHLFKMSVHSNMRVWK